MVAHLHEYPDRVNRTGQAVFGLGVTKRAWQNSNTIWQLILTRPIHLTIVFCLNEILLGLLLIFYFYSLGRVGPQSAVELAGGLGYTGSLGIVLDRIA